MSNFRFLTHYLYPPEYLCGIGFQVHPEQSHPAPGSAPCVVAYLGNFVFHSNRSQHNHIHAWPCKLMTRQELVGLPVNRREGFPTGTLQRRIQNAFFVQASGHTRQYTALSG